MINQLKRDFYHLRNTEKAVFLQRYFKTGKGEYAEGDRFLGVMVPQTQKLVWQYRMMSLREIEQLLKSKIHEHRLAAILILVWQFERGDIKTRQQILKLYLRNTKHINNWDLVDSSAPEIIGGYLFDQSDRSLLDKLAVSKSLWEQRMAILATQYFIQHDQYADTLRIAAKLLHHKHDLIHKAVGWMLREVGNRNRAAEERFLKNHFKTMPRTMLRYAIEKFPAAKRKMYLAKRV